MVWCGVVWCVACVVQAGHTERMNEFSSGGPGGHSSQGLTVGISVRESEHSQTTENIVSLSLSLSLSLSPNNR